MEIIPAILTNNIDEFEELVERIARAGRFSRAQVDFVDGEYANNKSINVTTCKSIKNYPQIKFDAQLMVVQKNVDEWAAAARSLGFDRIIPHIEMTSHPEDFSALALDIETPVGKIEPYLGSLNLVLLMSVKAGFGGQRFDPLALDKIRRIGQIRQMKGHKYKICVDGGIQEEHLKELGEAGVDEVAVGARRVLEW